MAIFKCKMCGGDLEITEGISIAECEYCGSKQTLPSVMDENLQNIFNRANTLRIKSEFDKAEKLYEKIIESDSTQAEAYWGLILCKYGIEYVDDPATFKKVPTCHRASYDSIIADDDYKSALQYADGAQRAVYEEQAKEIDRIQKEILALAQKEESYDVFICYKETDQAGSRTQDSVIANDIYYQLTNEGFKVFYAAITLEGKLGSAYEPIIFAALNSAKVMLAIGTKPEYFNAVWVKNEWSRYLKIIQKDRSKLLIPCYRDMDAYELPEEFAHLQAQDMSKIGFINDVVRGIKKVISKDKPAPTVIKETVVSGGNANTNPLLERAFMFLEDGDWTSANEYCEKVLDIDPKNANAYLGKLMAELKTKTKEALKKQTEPFDNYNNFQKAMRFADDNFKTELQGYIDFIVNRNLTNAYNEAVRAMETATEESNFKNAAAKFRDLGDFKDSKELEAKCIQLANECVERKKQEKLEQLYKRANIDMDIADTEEKFKNAARKFSELGSYKDCKEKMRICLEKAEIARKDAIYDSAVSFMGEKTIVAYKKAIEAFKTIEDWKDSANKIYDCERIICDLEQKAEAERIEAERLAEEKRIAEAKAKKKRKTIIAIITSIICAIVAFVIILNTIIIPNGKYEDAIALMNSAKYSEAITAFEKLDGYKDSSEKIKESKYLLAKSYIESKDYANAIKQLLIMRDYKDSAELLSSTISTILQTDNINILSTIPDDIYKSDAINCYDYALKFFNSKNYSSAKRYFDLCKDHKDANKYSIYCSGKVAASSSNWKSAATSYSSIKGFLDADSELINAYYKLVYSSKNTTVADAISALNKIPNKTEADKKLLTKCINISKCVGDYLDYKHRNNGELWERSLDQTLHIDIYLVNGVACMKPSGSLYDNFGVKEGKVEDCNSGGYTYRSFHQLEDGSINEIRFSSSSAYIVNWAGDEASGEKSKWSFWLNKVK